MPIIGYPIDKIKECCRICFVKPTASVMLTLQQRIGKCSLALYHTAAILKKLYDGFEITQREFFSTPEFDTLGQEMY